MGKIDLIIKALEGIHKGQEDEIARLVEENEKRIVDLNREQLFAGEDSTGKSLGQYKNPWYRNFKRQLNPKGVVDLLLHGAFYAKMYIKRYKFPIEIDSKDVKRNILVAKYGNIFGHNKESKTIFAKEIVQGGLVSYWKKFLRVR